jgi:hypothetical protein
MSGKKDNPVLLRLQNILYFYTMSNLYKIVALFSATATFLVNTSTENYGLLLNSKPLNSRYKTIGTYCSIERPDLFVLDRFGEKSLASFKHFSVSNLKNQANSCYCSSLSSEIKKSGIYIEYFTSPATICRNLTNSDIIYPFHYFW